MAIFHRRFLDAYFVQVRLGCLYSLVNNRHTELLQNDTREKSIAARYGRHRCRSTSKFDVDAVSFVAVKLLFYIKFCLFSENDITDILEEDFTVTEVGRLSLNKWQV